MEQEHACTDEKPPPTIGRLSPLLGSSGSRPCARTIPPSVPTYRYAVAWKRPHPLYPVLGPIACLALLSRSASALSIAHVDLANVTTRLALARAESWRDGFDFYQISSLVHARVGVAARPSRRGPTACLDRPATGPVDRVTGHSARRVLLRRSNSLALTLVDQRNGCSPRGGLRAHTGLHPVRQLRPRRDSQRSPLNSTLSLTIIAFS